MVGYGFVYFAALAFALLVVFGLLPMAWSEHFYGRKGLMFSGFLARAGMVVSAGLAFVIWMAIAGRGEHLREKWNLMLLATWATGTAGVLTVYVASFIA